MTRLALLSLVALLVIGCPKTTDPPIPPPNPPVDTDLCSDMCEHLDTLGCEEGKPVYNNDLPGPVDVPNQSCADNCKELQDKGFFVNPRCVLTVKSCEDIEPARQKQPEECGGEGTGGAGGGSTPAAE